MEVFPGYPFRPIAGGWQNTKTPCLSAKQQSPKNRYADLLLPIKVNGSQTEHIPVLAATLAEQITLPPDAVMVDATVGQAGHSMMFGKSLGKNGCIVGFDADSEAIKQGRVKLEALACKVILVNSNFSHIRRKLSEHSIEKVDFILADLGFSSVQMADSRMGLSFQTDMPLDMRFDKRLRTTAADIVNSMDEKSLADLIYEYGQDRASRRIARFIVRQRPIDSTTQLAQVVCRALARPGKKRRNRIHPATRTFQALRIAVNQELDSLQQLLDSAPSVLKSNGRLAVISFHSLEDRLVKNNFKQNKKDGIYEIITKKPLVACEQEISENRRARSAKLRIAQKLQ